MPLNQWMGFQTRRRTRPREAARPPAPPALTLERLEDRLVPSLSNHLLFDPVNGQPFTWQDQDPTTPAVIDIYFDFRPRHGFPNLITEAEKALVVAGFQLWSDATNGRLRFTQNPAAAPGSIINMGKGDLAAVGETSRPGGTVGVGGADEILTGVNGKNAMGQGFGWLDASEPWSLTPHVNVPGTIDFFTVAAHEIGHALGLDHTDNLPGLDVMDSTVTQALAGLSDNDVDLIQMLYPPAAGRPHQPVSDLVIGADAGAWPQVRVFNGSTVKLELVPYDLAFTGGVRVAVGDVTGDGEADVITAPGPGGGPDIKVFDGATGLLLRQFFAFGQGFRGGLYLAAGDVNGDGFVDVVTGADAGGGPNVAVFDGRTIATGQPIVPLINFFPYDPRFTGGVRVAAGDVNGDGRADVVCGAGPGGGPNISIISGADRSLLRSYFAYDPRFTAGVYVAAGDVDGDGRADVITGAGAGGGPNVTVVRGTDGRLLQNFFAYDATAGGGVRVAAMASPTGDVRDLVVTAPGPGKAAEVRTFNALQERVDRFFALDSFFLGGTFVSARP